MRNPIAHSTFCLAILLAVAPQTTASTTPQAPTGTIIEQIPTDNDSNQQYALYLPTNYHQDENPRPILYVLDPRGRAIPGIERFLPAAERHGWIVVSSYQSRSDTFRDVNYDALNALLIDTQKRLRLNPRRFYLAGMSGTAHASWRFGQILEGTVAGVIAAVGGVQEQSQGPPGDATFAYYGITGTADFNYQEVLDLERHMLKQGIDHRIVIFEGRHGWGPPEWTNRAVDWMELQAVKRGLAPPDPALVDDELARARAAATTEMAATDLLERLRRTRDVVRDFGDLRDVDQETAEVARLEADPAVRKRRTREKKLAGAERVYMTARYAHWVARMGNPDLRPPTVTESALLLQLKALQKRAASGDEFEARSAQRILESLYTGVAFYHPRDFENAKDYERQFRSLELAVAIFPERVAAHWRLAQASMRAGRHNHAIAALRYATAHGRVDIERLKTDPTWEPLRERAEWRELVASVERALPASVLHVED